MSKNNVFKLSGNMALGSSNLPQRGSQNNGGIHYSNTQISNPNYEYGKNNIISQQSNYGNQNALLKNSQNQYGGGYGNTQNKAYDYEKVEESGYRNRREKVNQNQYSGKNDIISKYENHAPQSYSSKSQQRISQRETQSQQFVNYEKNKQRNQPKSYKNLDYEDNFGYQQPTNQRNNPKISTKNNGVSIPKNKNTVIEDYPSYNSNFNLPSKEDIPIREINRSNKVDIQEYDPSQFMECRAGCGRKFNPDSLAKHQAICKKVFQKKRKEFNSQAHRIVENEQIKFIKKGQAADKKIEAKTNKKNVQIQKMAKWKAESLAFRAVLKENQKGKLSQDDKKMIEKSKQAQQQNMIKCPHCGRTFNQNAGPRHVTFCQNQQKKMVNKKKK